MNINYKVLNQNCGKSATVKILAGTEAHCGDWTYYENVDSLEEAEFALKTVLQNEAHDSNELYDLKVQRNLLEALLLNDCVSLVVRDREAGNVIDSFSSIEDAQTALEEFEQNDKDEGTYTPDFYEIAVVEK